MYYESSKTLILQIAFGCGSQAHASCWGGGWVSIPMNQRVQVQVTVLILQELEDRNAQISGLSPLTLPEDPLSATDSPHFSPIWTTF